jgi:cytochrome oxidase Cu insertion factor (SCO1/SenC/PrrC family)
VRNRITGILLLALSLVSVTAYGQEKKPEKKPAEPSKIKVGDMAPDFTLLAFDGQSVKPVSLHDFRGKKNVALAFFVFAFTGG